MQPLRSVLERVASRYSVVSFKSLALWRVVLGITCLQVVMRRWGMLQVFYAGTGAYPPVTLDGRLDWTLGPLRWLSSEPALHLVFALCLLITLAFTAGLWTRVVKFLLLPVLVIIDGRTPALFTGGEVVLHLQALYACLFPLGRELSADDWLARRKGQVPDPSRATSLRTLAYPLVLLQLSVIYAFNALSKYGETWQDGTALARALGAATLVSDFGASVAALPEPLLRALSRGTLIIEFGLPVLLLSPWYRRYAHAAAAVLIVGLHGGILLAMEVGSFSQAMISHAPLLWHPRGAEDRVQVPAQRKRRWEAFVVVCLIYLMGARLGHDMLVFPNRPRPPLPDTLNQISLFLGIWQPWMMFSPDPPQRDFVIVTDAVTRDGRHFDPWRQVALGPAEPLKELPASVVRAHAYTRYENMLSEHGMAKMHPHFASWVLKQRLGHEPVERFDSWLMVISTDPRHVVPAETLETRVGVMPLPLTGALPIKSFQARGIWTPERALDQKVVPEGTHVFTPISATMSAGCPSLTLDLGQPQNVRSAYFQADAADHFLIDGSLDGTTFRLIGEMPSIPVRQHKSRIIELPGEPLQFVRLRPKRSRGYRHLLSEVALFDYVAKLPDLPARPSEIFISSLKRPTVVGIISGSNHPSPDCPAESPRGQLTLRK